MEAAIQATSLKAFIKVLQCLSKFGDDLHMHASPYDLRLSVVNQTKSAFCLVTLEREFFQHYGTSGRRHEGPKNIRCQLLVKSVLAVLSKQSTSSNVDMLVLRIVEGVDVSTSRDERGDLGVQEERDSIEARLIMKLHCKHGVTKTHTLHVGSSPFRTVVVDPNTTPSSYVVPSRLLREWLDHFPIQASSNTEHELGWHYGREEVKIKTFAMGAGTGGLQTSIGVGVDEFEDYFVDDTELREGEVETGMGLKMTIPMKEFRAALTLSESFQVSLAARYSEATQPLVLNLEIEGCKAEIVIATTKCQAFDVTEPLKTKSNEPTKVAPPPPAKRKAPTQGTSAGTQAGRKLKLSSQAVIPESQQIAQSIQMNQQEPLFFPGGSQREYDLEAMERSRQSQKIALEAAGLGNFAEDELAGLMEDETMEDDTMEDDQPQEDSTREMSTGLDFGGIPEPIPAESETLQEASSQPSAEQPLFDMSTHDYPAERDDEEILEDDEEALPPTAKPNRAFYAIYPN